MSDSTTTTSTSSFSRMLSKTSKTTKWIGIIIIVLLLCTTTGFLVWYFVYQKKDDDNNNDGGHGHKWRPEQEQGATKSLMSYLGLFNVKAGKIIIQPTSYCPKTAKQHKIKDGLLAWLKKNYKSYGDFQKSGIPGSKTVIKDLPDVQGILDSIKPCLQEHVNTSTSSAPLKLKCRNCMVDAQLTKLKAKLQDKKEVPKDCSKECA